MAKTDIGPKISVEGEKEYRQQMQSIIQKQKEYAAELKSTMASMDKNTSAEQRASSVAAILRKQIAAQTEALNAQKGMLLQATAQYGSASNQASAYRTAVYKAAAELANMKSRLSDAENGMGEFADRTDAATESVENFSGAQSSGGLFDNLTQAVTKGNLVASALEKVGSAVTNAAKTTVKTGVEYNSQMEQYTVAFTNMLGSAEEAEAALSQIKKDAAKTPFDTAGLVKANQLLISTGVDAKSARNTIMALGDAVKATGGGNDELSRMAQNLQQIKNAGKATSADIKQFAYAGIDIYGILADYTGKSTEDVQKLTITYDLLTNALLASSEEGGRYFGAMETQSQTLDGRISTLKDNATQLAGALTEGLASAEGGLVDMATSWVQTLSDSLSEGGVSSMVETGGTLAGEAIDSFTDYATEHMDGVIDTGMDIAFNLAGGIVDNSVKLLESAGTITESFLEGLVEKFPDIVEKGGELTGRVVKGVLNLSGDIYSAGKTLASKAVNGLMTTNWLQVGWNIASNIVQGFINGMKGADIDTSKLGGMGGGRTSGGGAGRGGKNRPTGSTNTGGTGGSSSGGDGGSKKKQGGNTKKAAQDTKKLAKTVTDTSTQMVKGSENIVGAISRTTDTAVKTYNVYDGTTKKLKGTTTETTQTITDSWTEMVNGIEMQFKKITTLTDGVVTDEKTTSSAAQKTAQKSTHTGATEYLTKEEAGIDNALGYISQTKETTQEVQQVFNESTGKMEDAVVGTTETITQCYKRIQDGQLQTIQLQKTLVNGVETGSTEKIVDAENLASKYTKNRTETMTAAEAGIEDAVGAVEVASQTATQTEKVLNKETGKMEEVVTGTTQTITYSFKRIVDGQEQAVTATETYLNGVKTGYSEVATDLNTNIKYTEGVLGGFSKFVLDLDSKLGGLDKAASNLTNSPLGKWFKDLSDGYRASDSFWDNIDVGSLLVSGLTSAASGFQLTGNWAGALAGGIVGIVGNLLGTAISTDAGTWGGDLVTGMAGGIEKMLPYLQEAVTKAGNLIKSFLHFSRPDEGPLRDYETWMPDMVQGMAKGIKSNAYLLQDAAADLSGKLKMQLQYDVGSATALGQSTNIQRSVSLGGVTLNVYPSQNMDAEEFAQYTINRLNQMIAEEAASNGEVPVF